MDTVANPRDFLASLFQAAVSAADPMRCIAANLPARPKGRTVVVGAGKGAAQLAQAFEQVWDGPLEGLVVTRYGYGSPCRHISVLEAGHPVPDENGLRGSQALMQAVIGLTADDLVVALICGGGSALLPMPQPGLSLDDEIDLNKALLASGAPISAMNAIRKQVSAIKGGRLALAAWPAKVVSLVVSDIPGDDPAQVASGPTIADDGTSDQALKLIADYRIDLPGKLLEHIRAGVNIAPTPADPQLAGNEVRLIASAAVSLEAAAALSRRLGVEAHILSDAIEGEARDVARVHGALAHEITTRNRPFAKPCVLLSGGETTVTLRGTGKGGRNGEFALSLAHDINGCEGVHALAADTDGIDGSETNAGAFCDATTVARMLAAGADPRKALANNDSWTAFSTVGDLFETGPTGTNVNDFRAILIQ